MAEDTTNVTGLGNVIDEFDKRQKKAAEAIADFAGNFEKLIGKKPTEPLNGLDVLRLMHKFYGEPKND